MFQDGLGLIVSGVAHSYRRGVPFQGDGPQEVVPEFPRRLLKGGDGALPLVFQGVGPLDGDGQAQPVGEVGHEPGVFLGLCAPKVVNQVRNVEVETKRLPHTAQGEKQGRGIRPAGDSDNQRGCGRIIPGPGQRAGNLPLQSLDCPRRGHGRA
jgi:hypothetical protein